MPDYQLEWKALNSGCNKVCGVDEAGRGPLAGPVFAAAVILPLGCELNGLDDSKKLSAKKREILFEEILQKAEDYAIISVDEKKIDQINILNATMEAMWRAVESLSPLPDYVIIDGNKKPDRLQMPCETVIKGDEKSMSVAAASVLAKVSRDRYMMRMAEQYTLYAFEKHKGYGTKEHIAHIREYGPCEIHRKSFLKKII